MRKDTSGELIPFRVKFIKLSTGSIVEGEVVCTSKYFENRTINIKFENGEFRKIRTISIIEFNGVETYI